MTSGGGEGRTNWESVTLIRIYLNITWTQQDVKNLQVNHPVHILDISMVICDI